MLHKITDDLIDKYVDVSYHSLLTPSADMVHDICHSDAEFGVSIYGV